MIVFYFCLQLGTSLVSGCDSCYRVPYINVCMLHPLSFLPGVPKKWAATSRLNSEMKKHIQIAWWNFVKMWRWISRGSRILVIFSVGVLKKLWSDSNNQKQVEQYQLYAPHHHALMMTSNTQSEMDRLPHYVQHIIVHLRHDAITNATKMSLLLEI